MTGQLHIVLVNEDAGHRFAEWSEPLEDTPAGGLFRALQREYGRCTSQIYNTKPGQLGWYFIKRDKYEDTGEPYLRGAWVFVIPQSEGAAI